MNKIDEYAQYFERLEEKLSCKKLDELNLCRWYYADENNAGGDYIDAERVYTNPANILGAKEWYVGCSKFVFTLPFFPGIIFKIPFLGVRYVNSETLEDDSSSVYDFSEQILYKKDYCEAEEKNFVLSIKEKLDSVFAATKYVTEISDMPIYVQEYLPYGFYKCDLKVSKKSQDIAQKILDDSNNYILCDLKPYLPLLIEQYGQTFSNKVIDFILENEIDDLHMGNVRYSADRKIKFSDYSGFEEDI